MLPASLLPIKRWCKVFSLDMRTRPTAAVHIKWLCPGAIDRRASNYWLGSIGIPWFTQAFAALSQSASVCWPQSPEVSIKPHVRTRTLIAWCPRYWERLIVIVNYKGKLDALQTRLSLKFDRIFSHLKLIKINKINYFIPMCLYCLDGLITPGRAYSALRSENANWFLNRGAQ